MRNSAHGIRAHFQFQEVLGNLEQCALTWTRMLMCLLTWKQQQKNPASVWRTSSSKGFSFLKFIEIDLYKFK